MTLGVENNFQKNRIVKRLQEDPEYHAQVIKGISDKLVQTALESVIAHGQLDPKGKSEREIADEFAYLLRSALDSGKFLIAVDYTSSILSMARKFEKNEEAWLAALFYVIWVEHILNGLISIAVSRRGESEVITKQIIRDVSLAGKFSWLMPFLGYKSIDLKHASVLNKLAEYRNKFAHYKWSYVDLDKNADKDHELLAFLKRCQGSIKYLARYRDSELFPVSKAKLRRSLMPGDNS